MSLSEKMPLTSVARMPYTQIIATSASIATVKKKKEKRKASFRNNQLESLYNILYHF